MYLMTTTFAQKAEPLLEFITSSLQSPLPAGLHETPLNYKLRQNLVHPRLHLTIHIANNFFRMR